MNKEKIALLVDSGTDVPAQIMEQYGMYMLPLQIIYKDRTYTDKVDITAEEILSACHKRSLVPRYLMARRSGNL